MSEEGVLLVDASVFITLADIGATDVLLDTKGTVAVPKPVTREITSEPAVGGLSDAVEAGSVTTIGGGLGQLLTAARHLGEDLDTEDVEGQKHDDVEGDVALLGLALAVRDDELARFEQPNPVVVTDDKPLRQTCKALSIPVSGSIGVLIRAVERGDLDAEEATVKLEAMDEVGARLSASLYRKAERMIEDAAEE